MIFGLETKQQLPERWTPLEAVAVIKCLDEDGDPALYLTSTHGLNSWERLGMLAAAQVTSSCDLRDRFLPDDAEDDEAGG